MNYSDYDILKSYAYKMRADYIIQAHVKMIRKYKGEGNSFLKTGAVNSLERHLLKYYPQFFFIINKYK